MKKLKVNYVATLCLVTLLMSSVFFISCEKDDGMDYNLNIPEEFQEVGKLHNQGLNHVFKALKEEMLNQSDGTKLKSVKNIDYKALVYNSTIDFCENVPKLKDKSKLLKGFLSPNKVKLKSSNVDSNSLVNNVQQKYLDQISISFKQFSMPKNEIELKSTKEQLKKELNGICFQASKELSSSEMEVIYSATGTGLASFQYWYHNAKKWYFALNYPEILSQYKEHELQQLQLKNGKTQLKGAKNQLKSSWFSDTWNSVENWWDETTDDVGDWWDDNGDDIIDVGISDAVGAGLGAAGGAAIGGIGAGPGAIGGGCIASANECINQLRGR